MNVLIRPIEESDVAGFRAALDAVCRERRFLSFLEAPAVELAEKFVCDNVRFDRPQFVAVADGAIVGWCDAIPGENGSAHVARLGMGVVRDFRGRGIGRQLIEATIAKAWAKKLEKIELSVYASNEAALRLYRRMGFVEEGRRRRARLVDGIYDDIVLMGLFPDRPRSAEPPAALAAHIRQADLGDAAAVSGVLVGAAEWLRERGTPMWKADELSPDRIAAEVADGLFFVAECGGEIAGVVKFQLEDELFWPDEPRGEAAYVHRLAVKRLFAGHGISTALLAWAAERARSQGRRLLRLDCEAARPKLRAFYERFGFVHHSDCQIGPYFVARYELRLT